MRKRLVAFLLALIMVCTSMPQNVYATENTEVEETQKQTTAEEVQETDVEEVEKKENVIEESEEPVQEEESEKTPSTEQAQTEKTSSEVAENETETKTETEEASETEESSTIQKSEEESSEIIEETEEDTTVIEEETLTEEETTTEEETETETETETDLELLGTSGETSGQCGDNVYWSLEDGVLTISGTGDMWDYEYIWFDNRSPFPTDEYYSLIIEEGITHIGDYAFAYNYNLIGSLTIPNSVTSIGEAAFVDCSGLTGSLTLPENLISIGRRAFLGCSGFAGGLTIPKSVTSIEEWTFNGCSGFTGSLILPESVTSIGLGAFLECSGFTGKLIIPNSVKNLGIDAFSGCSGFTGNLVLSESVTSIGNHAFSGCSGFTGNLIIPDGVNSIGDQAFIDCNGFNGKLILSNGVKSIGDRAFGDCNGFTGDLIIPNSVASIGDQAFIDCNGFTGDLIIPNSVASIGDGAFYRCKGFNGKLILSNGVTSIGEEAFAFCEGFTGELVIPNSVTSIGARAFWYCEGLKGELIIPNSVMSIGEEAFAGCEGFTGELVIPNSVTSIGAKAFWYCGVFTDIYLARYITYIGDDAFRNANIIVDNMIVSPIPAIVHCPINSYAYKWALQQGLEIETERGEVINENPVSVTNDTATLQIYNKRTQEIIGNAIIEIDGASYPTDSSGRLSVSLINDIEKKSIKITAEGYEDVTQNPYMKKGHVYRIGLIPEGDDISILSVEANYGDVSYDLLSQKMVIGYKYDIEKVMNPVKEDLQIKIKTNNPATSYEIISDSGSVILSGNTGTLTTEVITAGTLSGDTFTADMPLTSLFETGRKYYLKVTDSIGNIDQQEIGIKPTVNYLTIQNKSQEGSFSFGEKIEVTLPDDVPFLGGSTLKMGFDEDFPYKLEIDEKGVIRFAFNISDEMDLAKFGEKYKLIEKLTLYQGASRLSSINKKPYQYNAGFVDASAKIVGYGEGNISEMDEGKVTFNIGIMAEIEGKGGHKWYVAIGVIPINFSIEGSVKGSVEVKEEIVIENWEITNVDISDGGFDVKVKITGGAGVGIGVELNGSLSGSLNYVNKPARKYSKLWLTASSKVTASILGWEKILINSPEYQYIAFENGKDVQPYTLRRSSQIPEVDYEPLSRDYLNYTNGYHETNNSGLMTTALDDTRTVVKAGVYPAANPTLVEVNGTKYLFWLEDIASRKAANRSALVYATSVDGYSWSLPKRLLSELEDNTLDAEYDVSVADGKIVVAWQDATRQIREGDDVLSTAKALSVKSAVLDTQSGSVRSKQITTQAGYYMYPSVTVAGGEDYFAYVQNDLNSGDVLGNNTQHLYLVKGEEAAREVTLPSNAQIVNMEAGTFSGAPYIICELDMDGDVATDTDREIYAYSMQDGTGTNISNNSVCDTMPTIADSGNIYWYQEGNIIRSTSPTTIGSPIWETAAMESKVLLTAVTDSTGKDTLLWETIDLEAPDGSVSVYQTCEDATGTFGTVVKCAETTGTIPSRITALCNGTDVMMAHLEGTFLEDGTMLKDLCVLGKDDICDLAVDYVDYDEDAVALGESLPLTVSVTNLGNTVINQIHFYQNGSQITALNGLNLNPNESREITVNGYQIPSNQNKTLFSTLRADVAGDRNTADNEVQLILATPVFEVQTDERLESGDLWLDFSVQNQSLYPVSGTVKVHRGSETGEVIYEKALETVQPGEGYAYTVSLAEYQDTRYYIEMISDKEDTTIGNHMEFVYVGYGSGIEAEIIEEEPIEITSLSISEEELFLKAGDTTTLAVSSNRGSTWNAGELMWISSDITVAGVDENGKVTAYRDGSTTITAYYGDLSVSCEVAVNDKRQRVYRLEFDTQGGGDITPITGIIPGGEIELPSSITREGYLFKGWYTQPEGGNKLENRIAVQESMILYAQWIVPESEDEFWIVAIPEQTYTGSAIKPVVEVYDGMILLQEKKDYTVSYKNNIKVNDASVESKAPTVTVTGKGNYSGKESLIFKIVPKSLEDSDISASDIVLPYNKRVQKPIPTIMLNAKKLSNKKDFTVTYPDTTEGAYKEPGVYEIKIVGTGGYTGEQSIQLTITASKMMNKATVAKIANQPYTGTEIEPVLTVTYGKENLTEGTDFTISYENNLEIGTATAIITGIGNYIGEKRVTFKITGGSISKAKVTGLASSVVYTGSPIAQNCTLTMLIATKVNGKSVSETKTLKQNQDYKVSYQNNTKAGTATILFTGINGYSGTLKKTFRITTYDMTKDTENAIWVEEGIESAYDKGGCKPKPMVTFHGMLLTEGVDYKLSYQNNNVVHDGMTTNKQPTIVITGKGSFKGTIKTTFVITPQDLGNITITMSDITYKNKKNSYQSKPRITDVSGKVLTVGKDYDKTYTYVYAEDTTLADGTVRYAEEEVDTNDIPPVGTAIKVIVEAKAGSNYSGTISGVYHIIQTDLKTASVKVQAQIYTGKALEPGKDEMTVKIGSIILTEDDYEIVGYSNNINKGTAKVTIRGIGSYGGTKTVNFKIEGKGLFWWWR